jgi:DNA-binding MarR family transcriptional regulator
MGRSTTYGQWDPPAGTPDQSCTGTEAACTLGGVSSGSLDEGELLAWQAFLRAHHVVTDTLDQELSREQDLPLGSYEVLLHLSWAPGRALRMSELADRVLLSRSGISRLVDRLVLDGLVERATCDSDGRGVYAALTDQGHRRLRRAAVTHLRGVREHFTRRFSPLELDELARLLGKLLPA